MMSTMRLLAATFLGLLAATSALSEGVVRAGASGDPELLDPTPIAGDTVGDWTVDLAAGRHWHAVAKLRRSLEATTLAPVDRLALARAEAGWGNWTSVITTLEGAPWVARLGDGEGLYLRARALEETGEPAAAAAEYARYLEVAPTDGRWVVTASVRRARLLATAADLDAAVLSLESLPGGGNDVRSWAAYELAAERAGAGDVAAVRRLGELVRDRDAEAQKWALLPRAYLAAGDSIGALAAYEEILPMLQAPSERASIWTDVGTLRAALGNPVGARDAFLNALEISGRGAEAVRAATQLLVAGIPDASLALQVAGILDRANRRVDALAAYDRHVALMRGAPVEPATRLARARLLVDRRRIADAEPHLEELALADDPELAAPALDLLSTVRDRQGRPADAKALQDELVRRFPDRPESVSVVFFQADALHDQGELERASTVYRRAAAMSSTADRAGLSTMRLGQIRITQNRHREAADVFEEYLSERPDGPLADEAAYWAARSHIASGNPGRAHALLGSLRADHPISYYAVQTATLLGEPYSIEMAPLAPPMRPAWLGRGLELLDVLREAGLERSESAFVDRFVDQAAGDGGHTLLLAQGLQARGHTWRGISLAWDVRRAGRPWDRLLLETIYPFPFRTMVVHEAQEWGVDPFLMAGLIRQESAFWPEARSGADARGLMQVLPATGRELAQRIGPDDFADHTLYNAEVNLHLGTAYLRRMLDRYDNEIPIVLSAYNAGPSRANRWRRFPEATDPVRFTERIPFAETRGYVKNVTRNRQVYRFLYGDD